jgi:hypothetical protein
MADGLTREAFQENLNTKFRLPIEPEGALELESFEIIEGVNTPTQEQFAVHFHGPLDMPFQQGMHQLEHDKMGTFKLFLVPIGRSPEGMIYEAAFNRLIKQSEG